MATAILIMEVALAPIHTTEVGRTKTGGQLIFKLGTQSREWRWSIEEIVAVSSYSE
jgi:hypothetical protein